MTNVGKTNSNAIVTLTLGILSIVIPLLGFVLGIIGIILYRKGKKEMDETNEIGKGLAVSGLICSVVGIFIQLLVIIGILSFVSFGLMLYQ